MPKKSAKRSPRPAKKKGVKRGPGARTVKGAKKGAKKAAPKRAIRKRPPRPRTPAPAGPRPDGERLQKVLAAAGVASRRECEELITEGRVQVDGEIVTELGVRVDPAKQAIQVDGEALTQPKLVYFAINKPTGYVCTARDPSGRPRVTDLLPPSAGRVFNVGRLDMSSEGLILLTNDGELANKLTHPRHGVEKLYHVQVAGQPTAEALREVRRGVYLDEGRVAFANVRIKSKAKSSAILEVTLDEGRNREIRRVLARVGHKVQRLTRIAVGPVRLGEMPSGAYRPLTREELAALRAATAPNKASDRPSNKAATTRAKKRPTRKPNSPPAPKRPAGRSVIGAEEPQAPPKKKPAAGGKKGGGKKKAKRPTKRR